MTKRFRHNYSYWEHALVKFVLLGYILGKIANIIIFLLIKYWRIRKLKRYIVNLRV